MNTLLVLLLLALSLPSTAQCDFSKRIAPDGNMYFYMDPALFYYTKTKELRGGIITDKENYFIAL